MYSGSGTVNSQLYLTGGINTGTGARWHYLAVPSQQPTSVLTSINPKNLLLFDESKVVTDKMQGWQYAGGDNNTTSFSELYPTDGYNFYRSATQPSTATFTGNSLMETLGIKALDFTNSGWNLIGNSLTCGVNWNTVSFSHTTINKTVYYTINNQVASYVQGGPGVNGGTQHIPPLQGFFVKTNAAGTSINFDQDIVMGREHHNTQPVYYKISARFDSFSFCAQPERRLVATPTPAKVVVFKKLRRLVVI